MVETPETSTGANLLAGIANFTLLVLSEEYGNPLCRDFVGIVFPYFLLRTSK